MRPSKDRLGAAHDRALVRLLTTPAPNAAALADKLELAIDQLAWEHSRGGACMAALLANARGLAARGIGGGKVATARA